MRLTRRFAAIAVAIVSVAVPAAAPAAENGRLPDSSLARIYHPNAQLRVKLAKPAAAAFNTMVLHAVRTNGRVPYVVGPLSAYRDYAGQVLLRKQWCAAGKCQNAAIPGTSNHGWGISIDLASPTTMRPWIARHGRQFGWCKCWSDASWEAWHLRWRRGIWTRRPDPGPDPTAPLLRRGSGGHGQAFYVRQVQRTVGVRPDGEFGPKTAKAVRHFRKRQGLKPRAIVGPRTWSRIRAVEAAAEPGMQRPRPVPAPKPKPVPHTTTPAIGVDVSNWQGNIDWQAVAKAGIRFAIPKVSEGVDFVDRTWTKDRVDAIRKAGIVLGGYHFLRPRAGRDARLEARHFVRTARAAGWDPKRDLPLHADLESTTIGWCETADYGARFAREVQRLTRRSPLLYSYPGFLNQIPLSCRKQLGRYRLHIAHYRVTKPLVPEPWASQTAPGYVAWQYDDSARIPGINGRVDVNVIPGGVPALQKLTGTR